MIKPKKNHHNNVNNYQLAKDSKKTTNKRRCRSCGTEKISPRRRYCSDDCRKQILWVLSLSKGLLSICSARYAAFSFNDNYVILDILPSWSKDIARFINKRSSGKKPADDLKNLILESGEEWYRIIDNNNSKSYASISLLKKKYSKRIPLESVKPDSRLRPRFSKFERESIKLLQLEIKELVSEGKISKIKASYKKMAKIHHPDMGGDVEKFKKLNDAHQLMLSWAENPQFTSRRALPGCWSYDAWTNKWAPPL